MGKLIVLIVAELTLLLAGFVSILGLVVTGSWGSVPLTLLVGALFYRAVAHLAELDRKRFAARRNRD